ncbi:hypothetical protein GIW05_26495, partial [Pseudomonas syringae]|uniref:hypothetical protein n=1 Tax=Pseudomonas syringae TaxID=317 RepID=UPI001F2CD896
MPAALPYFFSEALRSRFTQDIQYATDEARITSDEGRWLRSLVATDTSADSGTTFPRVDRLTIEDGSAGNAELAGALFISDPDNADAPVFLSTLAFGVERFASRSLLLAGL